MNPYSLTGAPTVPLSRSGQTCKFRGIRKIALLLTILCASQLHSMELEKHNYMAMLPEELKQLIAVTLTQSDTLEKAINAIRALTQTNTEFNAIINDPITMRTTIRLLVQKFNAPSEYIAKKLSTPGSLKYIDLSLELQTALLKKDFNLAEILITDGADIDYQIADVYPMLCTTNHTINLLSKLNEAIATQNAITKIQQNILDLNNEAESTALEENIINNIQMQQTTIKSYKQYLQDLIIPNIHYIAANNKEIFKNDGQLDQFIQAIDKNEFKKAFAIINPNTIMSFDSTYYYYQVGHAQETMDMCAIGANFSLIMYAVTANQIDLLKWLINQKANLDLSAGTGDTALLMAIKLGKKEIIKLLIQNGANINWQNILTVNKETQKKIDESDVTPLGGNLNPTNALYQFLDTNTFRLIFEDGLAVAKETPLIRILDYSDTFSEEDFDEILKLFLNNGANPNLQYELGNTALMNLAFRDNHVSTMKLLLEYGADPSIKNMDNQTALDCLQLNVNEDNQERKEKIQLLESALKKMSKAQ